LVQHRRVTHRRSNCKGKGPEGRFHLVLGVDYQLDKIHYRVRTNSNGQAVADELVSINSARTLTAEQFAGLSDIPPELEWLANITNAKTRRAYKVDVAEFIAFTRLVDHSAIRTVTRAHIIARRKDMESRDLAPTSIRRKLSALSPLFDYLCERNAVLGNPVDGVKRPVSNNNEGSTPALGDAQVRRLLEAPAPDTLKGVRDRAILATLLYHGIRREELCLLRLRDLQSRQGVMHFRVKGKRDKIRFVPVHPMALRLIGEYLEAGKHGGGPSHGSLDSPLFRPVANNRTGTNALSNEADIAKVQEWLGHANVSTTRLNDRRKTRPEDSPTFHVKY
jgi:integrase/recombinase XerD